MALHGEPNGLVLGTLRGLGRAPSMVEDLALPLLVIINCVFAIFEFGGRGTKALNTTIRNTTHICTQSLKAPNTSNLLSQLLSSPCRRQKGRVFQSQGRTPQPSSNVHKPMSKFFLIAQRGLTSSRPDFLTLTSSDEVLSFPQRNKVGFFCMCASLYLGPRSVALPLGRASPLISVVVNDYQRQISPLVREGGRIVHGPSPLVPSVVWHGKDEPDDHVYFHQYPCIFSILACSSVVRVAQDLARSCGLSVFYSL